MDQGVLAQFRTTKLVESEMLDLILSAGNDDFEWRLVNYLYETCEADHFTIFQLNDSVPKLVMSGSRIWGDGLGELPNKYLSHYWHIDPLYEQIRASSVAQEPSLIQLDTRLCVEESLRAEIYGYASMRQRNVICGSAAGRMLGLSLMRHESRGMMSDRTIEKISQIASTILSIVAKHQRIVADRVDILSALTSLDTIEACVNASSAKLPRREAQVCARILYGVSSAGIASELAISEETVTTYRKRVYHRLGIGSQYELLRWYMAQWTGTGTRH